MKSREGAHLVQTQWEYCKLNLTELPRRTDDIDLLNDAGNCAWELVLIAANNVAYLKRRLREPAPTPSARPNVGSSRAQKK
jgi:hypothetical protein